MNRLGIVLAGVLMAVHLSGCRPMVKPAPEEQPPYSTRPGMRSPQGMAAQLLGYFDYVRDLPGAEGVREIEKARRRYLANKSDFNGLQYCLALLARNDDWHRAEQLLEPMTRAADDRPQELRGLAILLYSDLLERHRLEMSAKHAEERADILENQLEELKTIEKTLLKRDSETGDKR